VILNADGRAEKVEGRDQFHRTGSWRVNDDGMLDVTIKMQFRIDSKGETAKQLRTTLMDVETIPTDCDFPWTKIDTNTTHHSVNDSLLIKR